MRIKILVSFMLVFLLNEARAQCTFPSQFSGTTWHDNTKGNLTFTETTMTGWNFNAFGQDVDTWQCLDNSTSNYLILKATATIRVSTKNYYAYLCLKLTNITSYSYYYYQLFSEQPNADNERVKISETGTLSTASEVCDTTFSGDDTEFHVLVRSGFESSAAVTCPESLLFSGDYLYLNSDGTFDCNGTTDVMDVCTDSKAVTFDYTQCTQRIGYSENGSFYCVANLAFGGYDYVVLYNRDTTVTVSEKITKGVVNHDTETTRFSCLCTDGSTASVSPHNCATGQTPSGYPTLADLSTVNGYLLVFNGTKYVTCPPTTPSNSQEASSLSAGAVAAIIVVVLLLLVAVIVIIVIYIYLRSKKNRISESEKPRIANGALPVVETVDETSKRNKLLREGTTLSREGTLTSLKKQGSNVSRKNTGKSDETADQSTVEKPFLGLSFLSFCPCKSRGDKSALDTSELGTGGFCTQLRSICPCGKNISELEDDDTIAKSAEESKGKAASSKKGPGVKGSKLAAKKGGKAKGKGGKGSKDKAGKDQSNIETGKSAGKSKDKLTKSDIIIVNTPRPGSPSEGVRAITVETTETSKGETKKTKSTSDKSSMTTKKKKAKGDKEKGKEKSEDNDTDTEKEKISNQEKSKLSREKTDVSGVSSVRRPGTVLSISGIESTVHTEQLTEQNVQPKPTNKKKFLDWNFLVCLQGNRSPTPQEEQKDEAPIKITKKPEKSKGGKLKKGNKKGGAVKGGKKDGEKSAKAAEKKESVDKPPDKNTDTKDQDKDGYAEMPASYRSLKQHSETEQPSVERSKTLPLRREETTVTLQDGKIAVDVYVPDEKTKLQLKDTVRPVEDKKGKDTIKGMTKAKTTLGTTRPNSSKGKTEKVKKGKLEPADKSKKAVKKKTDQKKTGENSQGKKKKKK